MIVERAVFRAKFGQGDTIVDAFKQWQERFSPRFGVTPRILVDRTGPMFTVVVEFEYRDMAHLQQAAEEEQRQYGTPEFEQWFATWSQAVERGSREVFQVVE